MTNVEAGYIGNVIGEANNEEEAFKVSKDYFTALYPDKKLCCIARYSDKRNIWVAVCYDINNPDFDRNEKIKRI